MKQRGISYINIRYVIGGSMSKEASAARFVEIIANMDIEIKKLQAENKKLREFVEKIHEKSRDYDIIELCYNMLEELEGEE
jgi:hypothetical protein